MELLLYVPSRLLIGLAQLLPLGLVARLGRLIGGAVYLVDARHRKVAIRNLTEAFGSEKPESEIRAIARENFRRIGESFASAIKTMGMKSAAIPGILEMGGTTQFEAEHGDAMPGSRVFAVGHFGNFELYARCYDLPPGAQFATTYRGLRQKSLDRLLGGLREQTGCLYFERRRDARELKTAMNRGGIYLGLLADQHAGDNGLRLPFFGRDCSVSAAPAVFALRYDCPLHVVICHRVALARWRIVFHDPIPTHVNGRPRESEDIMRDVNRQFEEAIRADPANWFWVHNRWKPAKKRAKRRTCEKPLEEAESECAPAASETSTLAQEAALFLLALRDNLTTSESVIRWADQKIVAMDRPPEDLIEVSTTQPDRVADLISNLGRLSAGYNFWETYRDLLGAAYFFLTGRPESAEDWARRLYLLVIENRSHPEDLSCFYCFDDAFDLARDQGIGTREEVLADFLSELGRYKDRPGAAFLKGHLG